jgi:TrmH family RNA methyltransferase
MPFRIVQSKNNARLKELRRALARPGRDEGAFVGIEGPNLLKEALQAGLRMPVVFVAEETQHLLSELRLGPETEVLLVPGTLLSPVLETETPQAIAALVKPPRWTWEHLFEPRNKPALIVILAGLQDPGNVGTILRSAEAFGANGVVSLPGTVNPWNQKSLRASAGSVFRLPVIAVDNEECFRQLREARVKVFTTALRDAMAADAAALTESVALLIGNEGNGVAEEIAARADGALTIPCPGPVESLNAAVAASVLLYEASRQRLVAAAAGRMRA